jgi:hypothetical protein
LRAIATAFLVFRILEERQKLEKSLIAHAITQPKPRRQYRVSTPSRAVATSGWPAWSRSDGPVARVRVGACRLCHEPISQFENVAGDFVPRLCRSCRHEDGESALTLATLLAPTRVQTLPGLLAALDLVPIRCVACARSDDDAALFSVPRALNFDVVERARVRRTDTVYAASRCRHDVCARQFVVVLRGSHLRS